MEHLSARHYIPPPVSVEGQRERRGSQSCPSDSLCPLVPEALGNATSLRVEEGQSLRLVCDTDSHFPARLSWSRGSLTLSPSQPSDPGVLVLPRLVLGDGGEFTCRAQQPWGFNHVSLNLIVQGECTQDTCIPRWGCGQDQGVDLRKLTPILLPQESPVPAP